MLFNHASSSLNQIRLLARSHITDRSFLSLSRHLLLTRRTIYSRYEIEDLIPLMCKCEFQICPLISGRFAIAIIEQACLLSGGRLFSLFLSSLLFILPKFLSLRIVPFHLLHLRRVSFSRSQGSARKS